MTGQVTQAVDEARGFCKDEAMVGSSSQFCLEHWWEGDWILTAATTRLWPCGHICVGGSSRGVWDGHGSADETQVCNWIPPCEKNGAHWHSLMLAEYWWRPNPWIVGVSTVSRGWCISTVVTVGHLCLCKLLWAWHAGFCSLLAKMHRWWWRQRMFYSWEFAQSNSVIVDFISVVVSMEINGRHYFWSDLYVYQTANLWESMCKNYICIKGMFIDFVLFLHKRLERTWRISQKALLSVTLIAMWKTSIYKLRLEWHQCGTSSFLCNWFFIRTCQCLLLLLFI